MTDEKITALPAVAAATLADIIYAVQGGISSKETLQQVFDIVSANTIKNFPGNPNGNVAGTAYNFCWDTVNDVLYVCTVPGTSTTAVWVAVATGPNGVVLPAKGGTGVVNPSAHTLPVGEGSSNFNFLGPLTNGQLLIGSTGNDPIAANLLAGSGISISNGSGTITIAGTGSGIGWIEVTSTSQTMVADNGYVANNAGLITFSLPVSAAFGTAINIIGKGAGGWTISQNSGQSIVFGTIITTVGIGGSISSTNANDSIELICTTANTIWTVLGAPQGNLTYI